MLCSHHMNLLRNVLVISFCSYSFLQPPVLFCFALFLQHPTLRKFCSESKKPKSVGSLPTDATMRLATAVVEEGWRGKAVAWYRCSSS